MKPSGVKTVVICPWALREGILLRCPEDGPGWWAGLEGQGEAGRPLDGVAAATRPLRVARSSPLP